VASGSGISTMICDVVTLEIGSGVVEFSYKSENRKESENKD